jgi:sugar lactone lactonase YvrE
VALARGWGATVLPLLAVGAGAGAAHAEAPRLIPDGQLESGGALGVAVDQAHGDVYVAGFLAFTQGPPFELFPGRVNGFTGSGKLLSPPSPFGEATAYSGAAVNPANGDMYALDALSSEIDAYEPATGMLVLPSFPVTASHNYFNPYLGNPTVVGIAADPTGDVYLPQPRKEEPVSSEKFVSNNEVHEYSSTGTLLKTFTGGVGSGALKKPTGVAVDAAGNLWVADTGNNRIVELNQKDEQLTEIHSEGVGSVALDAHGDVFAIVNNSRDFCGAIKPPCSHLVEYDPAGAQVADLGAGVIGAKQFSPEQGSGHQHEPLPDMVAVSDATGEVYVSEAVLLTSPGESTGRVLKYRPPVAPTLGGESAVEVEASTAKLGAAVNPGGLGASYRFEYGTTTAYGSVVPFPEGDTGAGFTSRTVWAGVSGLQPGTTYHYRVVVAGALGEPVVGSDRTFTTGPAAGCPNEAFRTAFSASLPDCRAYELVTPPNKDSAQPDKNYGGTDGLLLTYTLQDNRAAADAEGNGNGLVFNAEDVLPGSPSAGQDYVATRGSGGWSSQNVFPPTDYYGFKCPQSLSALGGHAAFSEDLSKTVVNLESAGQPCGVDPELVKGEPRGSEIENLFVRDNATGAYQLIDLTPEGVAPATPSLLGESPNFSRIVFSEKAQLTPGAPAGVVDIYEWSAGHIALATVLGDGTPVPGSFAGISADGSRVFFTAGGGLYARVDGAETVQLDASQAGGAGGGGTFRKASHDGAVVLFSADASAGLTSDTVPGSGTNLYRYDSHAPAGQRLADLTPVAHAGAPAVSGISKDGSVVFFTDEDSAALTSSTEAGSGPNLYRYEAGHLTDLTPAKHADVQGVLGVSENGSSVYFSAAGVLTSVPNQHNELPKASGANLYLWRGGASAFIAGGGAGHFRVSANGGFLLFESGQKLTGYDNRNPATGTPATELYLYDATAGSLACASCNPSGEPPTAFAIRGITFAGGPDSEGGAIEESGQGRVAPRQLSENGQVFFDSAEGLLPADTNGKAGCPSASGFPQCTDVYEFEPDGVGRCADPAGCLTLISTGTGALETFLVDANPSGNDVFIREFQKLVPRDTQEGAPSLYDVRVNGGIPGPAPPPPCDTPDACRTAPTPQPTLFSAPASQTFSGAGNLIAPLPLVKPPVKPKKCRKGYVKNKKGKCVKAQKAKKAKKTNRKGSK